MMFKTYSCKLLFENRGSGMLMNLMTPKLNIREYVACLLDGAPVSWHVNAHKEAIAAFGLLPRCCRKGKPNALQVSSEENETSQDKGHPPPRATRIGHCGSKAGPVIPPRAAPPKELSTDLFTPEVRPPQPLANEELSRVSVRVLM